MIDKLIEYANQTLQIPELLNLAEQRSPGAYEKHKPYYELLSTGRKDLVGRNVGKYHVVELLGKGGMADVYKAYQSGLARYVAIKVIHSHLADNEEFIERFEREAMAVGSLRHPNIVQVFDFDRADDRYYMVMEHIGGPTLAAEIRERSAKGTAFSLNEILSLFAALTSAIDYAHSRGMIHRDLKPSNIMFMPDRRVVLTDFGLARIVDLPSYTMTNAVMGTPAYMSPEQAQGLAVDARSDIYSLGVILYELVTGRRPFEGQKPVTVIMKLVSEIPVPPTTLVPSLPPEVESVILTTMSKDPADRYSSAGTLYRALRRALRSIARDDDDTLASASREIGSDRLPQETKPKNKGMQPESVRGLQKADIPDIVVGGGAEEPPQEKPQKSGQAVNISGSSGPVAIGGQHVVQIGSVSGGQVSIGAGNTLPAQPPVPGSDPDLLLLRQLLAQLKARVEGEAPLDKQLAALEKVSELEETLTTGAPDLDTLGYVNNWFARQLPALAPSIAELVSHPVVGRLVTTHDPVLAAEYRRRFGLGPSLPRAAALSDPGTTLIGRRMGQYFVVEQVGKGALARVYRGYHVHTREDVAIKVFFNYLADDEQFIDRFRRDSKAMIALRHPNIVPVLDFETRAEEYCFMVMAYIIGGTLKAHLARLKRAGSARSQSGGMLNPVDEVVRIGQEIAAALDYAHTRGIIHHNLTPANIMFTPDKQTVVSDFGLARLMGGMEQTMTGSSWRSAAYIAPEHVYGKHSDTRSDLYSLGAILFELLTGSPLHKTSAGPMEQLMKHLSEPVPALRSLNPKLPATVEPVFEKALEKEPQARYQTAGELMQALTLALQN
jgi:serine/threonine protein kinase